MSPAISKDSTVNKEVQVIINIFNFVLFFEWMIQAHEFFVTFFKEQYMIVRLS